MPGNMLKNRDDGKNNEINDSDLKELHAKAHGKNCMCNAFNRANLPGFATKAGEEQNELQKRSADASEDETVTADKIIDFFDARKVEQLLQQFSRFDRSKNEHK